jgi:4-amino-4-deoxy-L-arabinose transferase-like glycosyltransferase
MLQIKPARTSVGHWSFIVAALLAAFYLATSVYVASHHLLWLDELFTVLIARLPGWRAIWRLLAESADGLPPTYYLVVRVFDDLFGHTDVAARLPSALGMAVGLLLTFDCARRLTDGLHGLIAFSLLTCSSLPWYGYDARSYALYFMLAALALWVWTHTRDASRLSAVLFGVVLFLSITMHYYAVLCLVPYAVWEVLNWKPWRLPSVKMMGGLLGVLCAMVVLWGPIQGARRQVSPGFFLTPSPRLLLVPFSSLFPEGLFPEGLFLMAMGMVWIAVVAWRGSIIPLDPMQPGERVGWFFIFIPLAGYVLGKITHTFVPRYFICTLPGVAVAVSCWLWRHFRETWRVPAGILLLLVTWGSARQVWLTRNPGEASAPGFDSLVQQVLGWEDPVRNDGKQFLATDDVGVYLALRRYSTHPDRYTFLVVGGMGRIARGAKALARYYPLQVWTLEDLKKHARETALIVPQPGTMDALKQQGFQSRTRFPIKPKFAQLPEVVYLE